MLSVTYLINIGQFANKRVNVPPVIMPMRRSIEFNAMNFIGVSALTAEATTIPKEHIMNSATPVDMNKDIK